MTPDDDDLIERYGVKRYLVSDVIYCLSCMAMKAKDREQEVLDAAVGFLEQYEKLRKKLEEKSNG